MCNSTLALLTESSTTSDLTSRILSHFINACEFFVTGPLMVLSMPLTILTILVFFRTPLGTTKTTRIYYSTIAVCNLISTVIRDGIIFFPYYGIYFITLDTFRWDSERISFWSCRILVFVLYTFEMFTNNTYVALALERCIVLYLPLQSAFLVGQRKAAIGVAIVALGSLLVSSCALFGAAAYSETTRCSINFNSVGLLSRLALLMVFLSWITPTGITIILNTLIILKMTQSQSKSLRLRSQSFQRKAKQTDASLTLVIITGIHALVYLPMGVFRMIPLLMYLDNSVESIWNIMAYSGYAWLVITHVANYFVYYNRVKGFKENIHCILKCKPAVCRIEELASDSMNNAE